MPTPPESASAAPARSSLLHPRWLLLGLVALGLLAAIRLPRVFDRLGLPDYGHWFLDSYAILAANDAVTAGLNPYESVPLDILKRKHVYSDWWLGLRHLGVTRQDNFVFGGLCGVAFLAVALAGLRPRRWREALVAAALVLSPPVLLALNRANNDLVIFALLGFPLLLWRGEPRFWSGALLAAAIIIATGLKYYPVAAVTALPLVFPVRRLGWWLGTAAGIGAFVALAAERGSLARGAFAFPESVHLFGSPEIWRGLGLGRGAVITLSAALLAVAAWVLARRGTTKDLAEENAGDLADRGRFAVGALLLLACFLAGTSFAYRWIFALWLVPWLWTQVRTPGRATGAGLALGLVLAGMWHDGLYCLVLNTWLLRLPAWTEAAWRYATQPLDWLLMALLSGWLLEAALRRLRPAGAGLDRVPADR